MSKKIIPMDKHRPKGQPRAVLLARVSHKDQEEGYSIAGQKYQLEQYCARKGLEVVQTFEIVESSTRGNRKDFMKMIDFIRKQKDCIALVADKIDRVQRSFKEYPLLDGLIQEGRLELHFNTENYVINRDSPSHVRTMWSMGVVFAQSYVDSLRDKVKRGMAQKLRQGEYTGAAPIGYLNVRDERDRSHIILDESRALLMRRIFTEYSTGQFTLGDLVAMAKKWGLKNARGKQLSPNKSYMHKIIQNPFYYGEMRIKDQLYPHVYEPLITKEVFDTCQAVLKGWHKKPFLYGEKDFIFRGLITCATTGKTITTDQQIRNYKNGNTATFNYLMPWNPENPKKKLWVREELVLAQVEEVFKQMWIDDDLYADIVEYTRRSCATEKAFHKRQVAEMEKEYALLQTRLDKLMDLLLDGTITREDHNAKRESLKNRQLELSNLLRSFTVADGDFRNAVADLLGLSRKAHETFIGSDNAGKRRLINFVFSNLRLNGVTIEYDLRKPFDQFINMTDLKKWSGREDSNLRPPAPEAGALPGCATPRHVYARRNLPATPALSRRKEFSSPGAQSPL